MQTFTGIEYIKIAIANAYGLDKELFEDRINWVNTNIDVLDTLVHDADEPPLFMAGVIALKDTLAGRPTGFMVGLDACASGLQIMGAIMGCEDTCRNTGLIDPNVRADIYTTCTSVMNGLLGTNDSYPRKDVKQALMTYFYGSNAKPKEIFGEGEGLDAFEEASKIIAKGAVEIREALIDIWSPTATVNEWTLPDGFHARVKVMNADDKRVELEVDDFKTTFTYRFYENRAVPRGVSLAANVIHSIDGMIVREMNRRCNYRSFIDSLYDAAQLIIDLDIDPSVKPDTSRFMSIKTICEWSEGKIELTEAQLVHAQNIIYRTMMNKPFELITVHDEFKCHPNYMNELRRIYRDIFVELSQSNILEDILQEITGNNEITVDKYDDISHKLAQSNYALA